MALFVLLELTGMLVALNWIRCWLRCRLDALIDDEDEEEDVDDEDDDKGDEEEGEMSRAGGDDVPGVWLIDDTRVCCQEDEATSPLFWLA